MVVSDHCNCSDEYATWQVMEEYIPHEVLHQYRNLFNKYDPDSTGVISLHNVVEATRKLGKNVSTENIKDFLCEVTGCQQSSTSSMKFVDFPEFLAIISTIATVYSILLLFIISN